MYYEIIILCIGIVLTLIVSFILPNFVSFQLPGRGNVKIDYPYRTTAYRIYVLYKKKFWVEGEGPLPEEVRANVKRIKLAKGKFYVAVKCNLLDGTYEYIFYKKGVGVKENKYMKYLKDNKITSEDFPTTSVLDGIYSGMPKKRRDRSISHPIPRSTSSTSSRMP